MGMLLQSHDGFDNMAEFEPVSGHVIRFSKGEFPDRASRPISGHIADLDGHLLILYRVAGVLHLRADNTDLELTDETHVQVFRDGDHHILTIIRDNVMLYLLVYRAPVIYPPLEMDPTMAEEQDFDFGVFIYNVARDTAWRHRIYQRAE